MVPTRVIEPKDMVSDRRHDCDTFVPREDLVGTRTECWDHGWGMRRVWLADWRFDISGTKHQR
jgi:hypothetical protein